jgi:hypothetical protein
MANQQQPRLTTSGKTLRFIFLYWLIGAQAVLRLRALTSRGLNVSGVDEIGWLDLGFWIIYQLVVPAYVILSFVAQPIGLIGLQRGHLRWGKRALATGMWGYILTMGLTAVAAVVIHQSKTDPRVWGIYRNWGVYYVTFWSALMITIGLKLLDRLKTLELAPSKPGVERH